MTPEHIAQLERDYISLINEHTEITCGDGWFFLIYRLCGEILNYLEGKVYLSDVYAVQVKEKFGQLRFYTQGYWDEGFSDLIAQYEDYSRTVCEETGRPGSLYKRGYWLKTLCEDKAKELGYIKATYNAHWLPISEEQPNEKEEVDKEADGTEES